MLFCDFFMKNLYFIIIFTIFYFTDFILGFSNAWKNNAVESKKMKLGCWKLLGYLLIIACCICVDIMIYIGTGISAVDSLSPISKIAIVFINLNEFISIIENAQKLGLKIPKFILKLVSILNEADSENE